MVTEILFSEGLVKALFATETFSIGLNMPAKVRPQAEIFLARVSGLLTRGVALFVLVRRLLSSPILENGTGKTSGSLQPER